MAWSEMIRLSHLSIITPNRIWKTGTSRWKMVKKSASKPHFSSNHINLDFSWYSLISDSFLMFSKLKNEFFEFEKKSKRKNVLVAPSFWFWFWFFFKFKTFTFLGLDTSKNYFIARSFDWNQSRCGLERKSLAGEFFLISSGWPILAPGLVLVFHWVFTGIADVKVTGFCSKKSNFYRINFS